MEECKNNNNNHNRKRVREDSEPDSPGSKIPRVDSPQLEETRVNSGEPCLESAGCELVRVDSVGDSSGVNEIHDDLLNILDDTTENEAERDPTMQGLDAVIKSFQEEILPSGQDPVPESGEFNPNLGYLLEASDNELGLPPTVTPTEEKKTMSNESESGRVVPEGLDLTGFFGFEDEFLSHEALGFGNGVLIDNDVGDNGGGYLTIDGLFDYPEPADILWRSESLQAM